MMVEIRGVCLIYPPSWCHPATQTVTALFAHENLGDLLPRTLWWNIIVNQPEGRLAYRGSDPLAPP